MTTPVHVAVAVIKNAAGDVLLSKRPEHVHQGGLWEFPGGKVEVGETVIQALRRELQEELGIYAEHFQPLISVAHSYQDKQVLLDVWSVATFSGLPTGREGQPLAWVSPTELARHADQETEFPLPAANLGIVKAIQLGSTMAITGDFADAEDFSHRLHRALARGAQLVQCRLPSLSQSQSQYLIDTATDICATAKIPLLINNHFNTATSQKVSGYHLSAKQLMELKERPLPSSMLMGASCHSLEELKQAMAFDFDYVTLSPLHDTQTHPQAKTIGWDYFQTLSRQSNLPVYGLGGLTLEELKTVKENGGQGIAAIGAFWND